MLPDRMCAKQKNKKCTEVRETDKLTDCGLRAGRRRNSDLTGCKHRLRQSGNGRGAEERCDQWEKRGEVPLRRGAGEGIGGSDERCKKNFRREATE
ncbi:hypothetical protein ACJRO7_006224 [Eucalyptus globulus]|uniref:Uncharacterized protein n=1 Tax=Eucalyptus globulus TaxID=34317 RepID=A0ABD3IKY7_EUCGL